MGCTALVHHVVIQMSSLGMTPVGVTSLRLIVIATHVHVLVHCVHLYTA